MMRPSFRRGSFSRVGGVVNTSLDELGLRQRVLEQQVVHNWRQTVGPQIAASSVAEKVRDGALYVICKSSMWANELSLHKQDIIKRLNKSVNKQVIRDIRFSARGFKRAVEQMPKEESDAPTKVLETVEVKQSDIDLARRVAAESASTELATRIEKAILTSKRLEEVKRQEGWKTCPKCSKLHSGAGDVCVDCRGEK